ncbi:MAG: hypothetical protein DWQ53_04240 [Microcystis flos-aquae DF17]|nr:MAG: hypothetical protein DWQ53_04240 [Microcystis flos-aquae DF17]
MLVGLGVRSRSSGVRILRVGRQESGFSESVVRSQEIGDYFIYSPHTPHPTPHTPHPTPHTPLPHFPIPPSPYLPTSPLPHFPTSQFIIHNLTFDSPRQ